MVILTRWRYLIIWSLIINIYMCHRVTESTEDIQTDLQTTQNTTTLYPISNTTNITKNEFKSNANTINTEATVWKIETAFAESKLLKTEKENITNPIGSNDKDSREMLNSHKNETANSNKFKPSLQVDTYDDSPEELPLRKPLGSFIPIRRPAAAFPSSNGHSFKSSLYHVPKDVFRQNDFPYKIENNILTKAKNNWQPSKPEYNFEAASLESKPTVEVPVRVPAGGLYKSPDAFKEKPSENGDSEDFGLDFNNDVRDTALDPKKRVNPWKNLLRLVTAFIPVGLIISALTPSVITIENTSPGNQFPPNVYRRSDGPDLGPISESCRRRLLCELHSERNYMQAHIQRKGKQCYKLRCEDPEALSRVLQWLLTYRSRPEDYRTRNFK
ncbi:uncharacterized protein ACR2FA_006258 [Aphomia sociella]